VVDNLPGINDNVREQGLKFCTSIPWYLMQATSALVEGFRRGGCAKYGDSH